MAKNVLRSLGATTTDMPPVHAFPKAHQVTFNYYAGVISFVDEDYEKVPSAAGNCSRIIN
jgi:hypothetical protein